MPYAAAGAADGVPDDWPGVGYSRFVDAGGLRWHVQDRGSGDTIVLLHGTSASLHSFVPLVERLAPHLRCISLDLPGHGFTSPFEGGAYTLRRTATAVGALIEAMGIGPAAIVGHSAGAAIALQWLLDRSAAMPAPPRLVAINPALRPFGGVAGFAFPFMARLAASSGALPVMIARRAKRRDEVEGLITATGSKVPGEMLDCYQRLLQRAGHVRAVLAMMAGWQLDHLVRALRALDPVQHVILGGRDRAVPPARTMATLAGLSNTMVSHLPEFGHLVHEEAPRATASLVLRGLVHEEKSND
jgi:magnesium chelatase accessory protein